MFKICIYCAQNMSAINTEALTVLTVTALKKGLLLEVESPLFGFAFVCLFFYIISQRKSSCKNYM